jgi:hypothetical protein
MTQQFAESVGHEPNDFFERCNREIVELHQFFENWLSGKLAKHELAFARFTTAIAPSMTLITTEGKILGYEQLVDWIDSAHGSEPGFALWVEEIALRGTFGPVALLTYEEWQDRTEGRNVRLTTVLFEEYLDAPNGVRWLHVHESSMKET